MRWWCLASVWLSGCGVFVDESQFLDDYPEQFCNRAITCLWPVPQDPAACQEERLAAFDQFIGCDFDGHEAGECLNELRSLSCSEVQYADPTLQPGSCSYVYYCPYTTE